MSRAKNTDEYVAKVSPLSTTAFPIQYWTKYRNTLESTLVLALAQEEIRNIYLPNERDMP
jgi:hypothetical protein